VSDMRNRVSSAPAAMASVSAGGAGPLTTHHSPLTSETSRHSLTATQWGMISFLASEVAFFSTLIVVYLAFMGADESGPTPAILALPLVIGTTLCLLSSSVTVHLAVKSLRLGSAAAFVRLWSITIVLGILFLAGTAYEWRELIVRHDLTISRNLFGTTYYTLVGFHALHVTMGVVVMLLVLGLTLSRLLTAESHGGVELVSWYWHFVDEADFSDP
jgi:cytochrome c oxidase subunit III